MEEPHAPLDSVDASVFVAKGAVVLGDVTVGAGSSIWFNAVVRGDPERIVIGQRTNIQDGCVAHTDPGFPLTLGARVTVGHMCMIHGCTIGDDVLVGIGSIVLNGGQLLIQPDPATLHDV